VVVDEIDQVTEDEQRVGTVAGPAQRFDVAVDVGDDVHPHDPSC
jgi:hypothetical protein